MTAASLSSREFGRRFRKALSVPFSLNQVCSSSVADFVTAYAASLGCSEKCFFFPLLSCTAACMGPNSHVELTSLWKEPPVVWTLVISPVSLHRVDVAEHLKQQLLDVENDVSKIEDESKNEKFIHKFMIDMFKFEGLQDMMKLNEGHALGLYNSTRPLDNIMSLPQETEIMLRLHSGFSWFSDSHVKKTTVRKSSANFAIISKPNVVHQTLTTTPYFQELFHQCFLTACAEESHVKFSQLSSSSSQTSKLKLIFQSLIKLHSSGTPIIYKLSPEASEKFSQIHDELTDKAKQMARKNAHKIFSPAVSYLGRLSYVLHVLDNIVEAANWDLPLDPLTWNTEISATTVWHARELLGHVIEQRHALMEQTIIESQPKVATQPIDLDPQPANASFRVPSHVPRALNSQRTFTATSNVRNGPQNPGTFQRPLNNNFTRRRLVTSRQTTSVDKTFNSLVNTNPTVNGINPQIISVCSAGIPVPNSESVFSPVITGCESVGSDLSSTTLPPEFTLPPSLSFSVAEPPLLSRNPTSPDLQSQQVAPLPVSDDEFLSSFRISVRKLLMHGVSDISPSRCVQLKLTPDPIEDGASSSKCTASFARSFLKRLELLGFGICEGPTSSNLRHFLFKKTMFGSLGEKQKHLLLKLRVSERDYNKCFYANNHSANDENGGIVCLE